LFVIYVHIGVNSKILPISVHMLYWFSCMCISVFIVKYYLFLCICFVDCQICAYQGPS